MNRRQLVLGVASMALSGPALAAEPDVLVFYRAERRCGVARWRREAGDRWLHDVLLVRTASKGLAPFPGYNDVEVTVQRRSVELADLARDLASGASAKGCTVQHLCGRAQRFRVDDPDRLVTWARARAVDATARSLETGVLFCREVHARSLLEPVKPGQARVRHVLGDPWAVGRLGGRWDTTLGGLLGLASEGTDYWTLRHHPSRRRPLYSKLHTLSRAPALIPEGACSC